MQEGAERRVGKADEPAGWTRGRRVSAPGGCGCEIWQKSKMGPVTLASSQGAIKYQPVDENTRHTQSEHGIYN